MTKSVYDPKQMKYRVQFACAHILRRGGDSRTFNTCFEMGDASIVAAHVYRRALRNPALMDALPRYLSVDMCKADYERLFNA